jgi:hypothetical protein
MKQLNFFQKLVVKNLVGAKFIGQIVKYAAGQAAAWTVSILLNSPAWLTAMLAHFSEQSGIEMNEATLTLLFGFAISEVLQLLANKINGDGAKEIQEAVGTVRDQWTGNKTVEAVVTLKADLLEKARILEASRNRIRELTAQIEEARKANGNVQDA